MRSLLLCLLIGSVLAGGWYVSSHSDAKPAVATTGSDSTAGATNAENNSSVGQTIRCLGKLEPVSGLIQVVAPAGSRIAKLTDKPIGATVARNEVLVTLQTREIRQQDLKLAKARRADALNKAEFEKEQAQYKLSSAKLAVEEANAANETIATEEKKIGLLKRQLQTSESVLNRLTRIRDNPTTSDLLNQTDLEKQQLLVEQLRLQIDQAKMEIDLARNSAERASQAARNNVSTIEGSLQNSDKAVPLTTLAAAVEMAQLALDMTEIKSPIDATILDVIVREGDSVTNKPVMVIGDTSEMHCVAEVSEQFLSLIDLQRQPNLKARISSPALGKTLDGTVISKGVMIGAASLSDPNPFAKVDKRTGNITIKLDVADDAAKLVNLQVNVEIEIQPTQPQTSAP